MDNLQCFGTETDIAACHFKGWGKSDCTYRESISITCGKYAMQLKPDLKEYILENKIIICTSTLVYVYNQCCMLTSVSV